MLSSIPDIDSPPLLEARGIERRFDGRTVWKGLNLTVNSGELILLAGANGAGKTTLLRSLAGLAKPPRGNILVAGRELYGANSPRGAIGFVGHDSFLYDDLTARENLRFAAALHQLDASNHLIDGALAAVGLSDVGDKRVGRYSRGMVQRLALARATLHAPSVLLFDEPFTGLDQSAARMFRAYLAQQRDRGCAIICVTHDSTEIWDVTTRVIVLANKQIGLDIGRPERVEEFQSRYSVLVA